MRKILGIIMTLCVVAACSCQTQDAFADGASAGRSRKPHHVRRVPRCGPLDRCGFPIACPDGTCYSLYGAYGPYGGPAYWTRYTYEGWGIRW